MKRAGKKYTTFNKVRLALFTRSYAQYYISHYLKIKYKINERLTSKELREAYFNKHAIPEISRMTKVLNFNYTLLWKSIIANKIPPLSKRVTDRKKITVFLSIENEIIQLFKQKQNKSDYFDPDYEVEIALLSIAIERAAGNALNEIEDDFVFNQKSEELKRKYHYWYYKVAYEYKLPTLRIIPFLLRLIS